MPSTAQSHHQDLHKPRPEEPKPFQLPQELFTHSYNSTRSSLRKLGDRVSRYCEIRDTAPRRSTAETPTPIVNVNLEISLFVMPSPCISNPRASRCRSRCEATCPSLSLPDPTLPRKSRDFADRGSTIPHSLLPETPSTEILILRICATCPSDDRRIKLDLVNRDLGFHEV